MADSMEGTVKQLETAIRNLRHEMTETQKRLYRQIDRVNNRLNEFMCLISLLSESGTPTNQEGTEPFTHDTTTISHDKYTEPAFQSLSSGTNLEKTLTDLKAGISLLQSESAWVAAANQDLSERLAMIRTEQKTYIAALEQANTEIARLKTILDTQANLRSVSSKTKKRITPQNPENSSHEN